MKYTFEDLKQETIGSFLAVIVLLTLRGGNPFFFNPNYGFIISLFVIYIYYQGFNMGGRNLHFIINLLVAFTVSAVLSNIFGLITYEEILTMKVFGSLTIVGTWIALPMSLFFDKFNFTNPLKRIYIRK